MAKIRLRVTPQIKRFLNNLKNKIKTEKKHLVKDKQRIKVRQRTIKQLISVRTHAIERAKKQIKKTKK